MNKTLWIYALVMIIAFVALLAMMWFYHWKPRVELHRTGPYIDPNAKCPGCGNREGSLKMQMGLQDGQQGERPWIKHICKICSAEWMEDTVMKYDSWWKAPLPK